MSIQCPWQSTKTKEAKEKEREERKKKKERKRKTRREERESKIPWAACHGRGRCDITVDEIMQRISVELTGGRCLYDAVLCMIMNSFQNTNWQI